MIRISRDKNNNSLQNLVLVAFEQSTGKVHGIFVHGSIGPAAAAELERSRRQLISDVRRGLGADPQLEILEVPAETIGDAAIDRVDVAEREIITKPLRVRRGSRSA